MNHIVAEVAETLKLSPTQIRRLIQSGELTAIRSGKRKWLISDESIADFRHKREVKARQIPVWAQESPLDVQRRELWAKCAAEAVVVEIGGEWVLKWREVDRDIVHRTIFPRYKLTLGKSIGVGAITRAEAKSLADNRVIRLLRKSAEPLDWEAYKWSLTKKPLPPGMKERIEWINR